VNDFVTERAAVEQFELELIAKLGFQIVGEHLHHDDVETARRRIAGKPELQRCGVGRNGKEGCAERDGAAEQTM
jgi:hypothetical protein